MTNRQRFVNNPPEPFKLIWEVYTEPEHTPLTEALQRFIDAQPANTDFHFSNGTAIRLAQQCSFPEGSMVFCNRGVSGIEGSTSSAIGSAKIHQGHTVLITGDVSFAYDISALQYVPKDMCIVVLDNNGGDIFRQVATTRDLPEREELFVVPPKTPYRQLAKAFGLSYAETDIEGLPSIKFKNIIRLIIK